MPKILKFGTEAREKLLSGISQVEQAVASTLGPKASNVGIDRQWGAPIVIHDGVGCAKEITLRDPFENMGAQMVKEAAQKTVDEVGDGTTTSVILCKAIATEAHKNIVAGHNAMGLRKGMELAVETMSAYLLDKAVKIEDDKSIEQVATIAAQNPQIGTLIAAAIKKLGKKSIITVEESHAPSMSMEYKEGMEFDRGFLAPHFMTDPAKGEANMESPYILVTDIKIQDMQDFIPFMDMFFKMPNKENNNLVIISNGVEGVALATLVINKIKANVPILAVQAPGFGDKMVDTLEDIATLTGASFISSQAGMKIAGVNIADLGRASRVVSTKDSTLIVGGSGQKHLIGQRVQAINNKLKNPDLGEYDAEKLRERLAKLTSGIAILKVGANSEVEMRELKERCIDAISATKAAIEEGIVPGGEIALMWAAGAVKKLILEGEERVGADIVAKASVQPFRRLMTNAGFDPGEQMAKMNSLPFGEGIDVMDGQVKDLVKAGIIDPVKVPRRALANAASIAIMVATTDTLISEIPEKKDQQALAAETPAY